MSGVPIKNFDFLLQQFNALRRATEINNSLLQEAISLLTPTTTASTINDMPVPLKIKPYFPTGTNFELPVNFRVRTGEEWLRDKLDSVLGINGFKGFGVESFDPNISSSEGYEILVNVDSSFNTLDISDSPCIECYLVNSVRLAQLSIMMLGGWVDYSLGEFPKDIGQRLKKGNFAGKLSSIPGTITLKPNLLSVGGFFFVKVQSIGWKTAVIDYNNETKAVTILGY